MNSLSSGFSKYSRDEIFKNSAQIKIYKDDEMSNSLMSIENENNLSIITNPQIVSDHKTLLNPERLLRNIKQENYITNAILQVDLNAFYNKGTAQLKGTCSGVDMLAYNEMYNTSKYMVAGHVNALQETSMES
ncbi:MAG: hypothetical protein IPN26_11475 [Bacteroidetes bacterium]|nr:hypothetical protein [Bacteroidota bacterium]